MRRANI